MPHEDTTAGPTSDDAAPNKAECTTQCINDCYTHATPGSLLCQGLVDDGSIDKVAFDRCKFQLCVEVCSFDAPKCAEDS